MPEEVVIAAIDWAAGTSAAIDAAVFFSEVGYTTFMISTIATLSSVCGHEAQRKSACAPFAAAVDRSAS